MQTHEYILSKLAIISLEKDGQTELQKDVEQYIDYLVDGVRAADLRLNGYFLIDCHTSYMPISELPEGTCAGVTDGTTCNNWPEWPVGDHCYDSVTGVGCKADNINAEIL